MPPLLAALCLAGAKDVVLVASVSDADAVFNAALTHAVHERNADVVVTPCG